MKRHHFQSFHWLKQVLQICGVSCWDWLTGWPFIFRGRSWIYAGLAVLEWDLSQRLVYQKLNRSVVRYATQYPLGLLQRKILACATPFLAKALRRHRESCLRRCVWILLEDFHLQCQAIVRGFIKEVLTFRDIFFSVAAPCWQSVGFSTWQCHPELAGMSLSGTAINRMCIYI